MSTFRKGWTDYCSISDIATAFAIFRLKCWISHRRDQEHIYVALSNVCGLWHNVIFGNKLISNVKVIQNQYFSRVEQTGHLSTNIPLFCDYSQEDPLPPYIFVIYSEILGHVVRGSNGANGIDVFDGEVKLSQYT